jgi:hypothetical protein
MPITPFAVFDRDMVAEAVVGFRQQLLRFGFVAATPA